MRSVTFVIVDEVRSSEWGIGGQAMTTDAVRALAAGNNSVPVPPLDRQ